MELTQGQLLFTVMFLKAAWFIQQYTTKTNKWIGVAIVKLSDTLEDTSACPASDLCTTLWGNSKNGSYWDIHLFQTRHWDILVFSPERLYSSKFIKLLSRDHEYPFSHTFSLLCRSQGCRVIHGDDDCRDNVIS